MLDKNGALVLGVTAGVGVGYLLGRRQGATAGTRTTNGDTEDASLDEIARLARPNILALTPYRCARDDYDQGILLDANENSLGPPFDEYNELRKDVLERYPCPYQKPLKQLLANYRNKASSGQWKVDTENIFFGVGSDEAIDLLIRVVCTPREDAILITPPTYGMYQVCANIHDVNIISVPLEIDSPPSNPKGLKDDLPMPAFHINPKKILAAATPETKIIFLCSPGNPTANALRVQDIMTILDSPKYKGLVVVDEAYIDFSETSSLCTLVKKYPRLVVLQTLSKAFGLAGIRLGGAFGDPRLIQILNNVKAPYNINKLTAKVAQEALSNTDAVESKIELIKKEKTRVMHELRKRSFVKAIYASDSNFVLFEVPNALRVYREMADQGVVIRYRGNQLLLDGCLRATIGSREENDSMMALLTKVSVDLQ